MGFVTGSTGWMCALPSRAPAVMRWSGAASGYVVAGHCRRRAETWRHDRACACALADAGKPRAAGGCATGGRSSGGPRVPRARIRGRTRERPLLVPDRPGHYLVRQRVSEIEGGRAAVARVGRAAFDDASVVVNPLSELFQLSAYDGFQGGQAGIKVGDRVSLPRTEGHDPVADARSRNALDERARARLNTYCCADPAPLTGSKASSSTTGLDQLVIIMIPGGP